MQRVKIMLLTLFFAGIYAPQTLSYAATQKHHFRAGQTIHISVQGEEELSKNYKIDEAGAIIMPFIGKIYVAGKSHDTISAIITTALKDDYILNPIVSVTPTKQENSFYILGAINQPGHYKIDTADVTIFEAVALAGGFKWSANKKQFEIIRKHNDKKFHIRGNSPYSEIQSGDIIIVDGRFF